MINTINITRTFQVVTTFKGACSFYFQRRITLWNIYKYISILEDKYYKDSKRARILEIEID